MLIHTVEKPHNPQCTCDVCRINLAYCSNVNLHMLRHHGIDIHKCAVCEKTFSQISHLTQHMATHTDVKPNKCDMCGETFPSVDNCNQHIFTRVKICDKSGTQETSAAFL